MKIQLTEIHVKYVEIVFRISMVYMNYETIITHPSSV